MSKVIDADYILPADEKMNPRHPEDAEFYNESQVAFVVQHIIRAGMADEQLGRLKVFTGYSGRKRHDPKRHYPEWQLGQRFRCYHDQDDRDLGTVEVVGIHHFASGRTWGEVPDEPLPHSVFK